jgi:uncharacterized membrane protein
MESTSVNKSDFNIANCLTEGWAILIKDFGQYIGLTIIYLIILGTVRTTGLGIFLVAGPLNIGFFYIVISRIYDKPFQISDISKGFNFYVHAILAHILIGAFSVFGFILCIIPGIFIYSWYLLAYIYIFDRDMDFWKAMEESRKIAFNHMFEFFVLALIIGIVFFAGLIFCGIGILIAIPYIKIMTVIAYKDLVGFNKSY